MNPTEQETRVMAKLDALGKQRDQLLEACKTFVQLTTADYEHH